MKYYKDAQAHILTKPDNSGLHDLYCKLCEKLYNIRSDLIPLIKYANKFYNRYSKEGLTIAGRLERTKENRKIARKNWLLAHPNYQKEYYQNHKSRLKRKNVDNRRQAIKRDPEGMKAKLNQYDKTWKDKPENKKKRAELQKIIRGLAMLGLGPDYQARYRIRQDMKARNLLPPIVVK